MEIEFAAGGIYEYFDVPKAVYEWLMRVPNKGRYVTRIIANKYRFRVRPAEAATEHGSSLAEQLQRSVAALSERSPSSSGTSSSVT